MKNMCSEFNRPSEGIDFVLVLIEENFHEIGEFQMDLEREVIFGEYG